MPISGAASAGLAFVDSSSEGNSVTSVAFGVTASTAGTGTSSGGRGFTDSCPLEVTRGLGGGIFRGGGGNGLEGAAFLAAVFSFRSSLAGPSSVEDDGLLVLAGANFTPGSNFLSESVVAECSRTSALFGGAAFLAGAFFTTAFLTGALFFAGFGCSTSSWGCCGRISPSRSAFRRTRSA